MKLKKLGIALASMVLAFSAVSAITGTYAWFTAANVVNVTGLNIKAEAEEGIVIAQEKATALVAADWKTGVAALHTGAGESFIPTTTKALNVSTGWEHANVDTADSAIDANISYESFTITPATKGTAASVATGTTATQVPSAKNVYLYNEFYIQAAAKQDMAGQNLYVKSITAVDGAAADTDDQALNKAFRVAFKIGSEVKVYCPLLGADFTAPSPVHAYNAAQDSQSGSTPNTADYIYTNNSIPAYTDAGTNKLVLEVFCWFEGEDANCKTSNIEATFNNITLSFDIANVKN